MNATSVEPRPAVCRECDGCGDCPDCNGWGIHTETTGPPCPSCGHAETSDPPCPACAGSGTCAACRGSGNGRSHR